MNQDEEEMYDDKDEQRRKQAERETKVRKSACNASIGVGPNKQSGAYAERTL
jgi:hypothetical protein